MAGGRPPDESDESQASAVVSSGLVRGWGLPPLVGGHAPPQKDIKTGGVRAQNAEPKFRRSRPGTAYSVNDIKST